jgi:hypothetical protein
MAMKAAHDNKLRALILKSLALAKAKDTKKIARDYMVQAQEAAGHIKDNGDRALVLSEIGAGWAKLGNKAAANANLEQAELLASELVDEDARARALSALVRSKAITGQLDGLTNIASPNSSRTILK